VRALVTGAKGQVGFRICERLSSQAHGINREEWDLSDLSDQRGIEILRREPWGAVYHCAAYTAVDHAESDLETLEQVTVASTVSLAKECARLGIPFVFFSTDYVFSEVTRGMAITEETVKSPVNAYGFAKSRAEDALLAMRASEGLKLAIIRTQWVYDFRGKNFLRTILAILKKNGSARVVSDQLGQTTWAKDLARAAIELVEREIFSRENFMRFPVVHFRQSGPVVSWADFAVAIAEEGVKVGWVRPEFTVSRISSSEYKVAARRPAYSVLSTDKIEKFGVKPLEWREALAQCFCEGAEELSRV